MPYKLLLADDSVTIQRVIELTFADEDVTVTAVGDGQLAIDRILSDPPDIVLADVGMPKRDGYEVASFIKNDPSLEHIPVLLLTGAFEPVDEDRAHAVRCNGVLAKPFEPQLLIARVKELLSGVTPNSAQDASAPSAIAAVPVATEAGPVPAVPAHELMVEFDDDATVRMPRPPAMPQDDDAPIRTEDLELRPDAPQAPDATLDDYFDRLDAAFAHLTGSPQPGREATAARPAGDPWAAAVKAMPRPQAPAAESYADIEPERARPVVFGPGPETGASSSPADDLEAAAGLTAVPVPDAFASLLDAERQHGPDAVLRAPTGSVVTLMLPGTVVTDQFLDDLVRKVIERLGDPVFKNVVSQVVSETAERLIREEIARLKARL